jgi:hypothetical protein
MIASSDKLFISPKEYLESDRATRWCVTRIFHEPDDTANLLTASHTLPTYCFNIYFVAVVSNEMVRDADISRT